MEHVDTPGPRPTRKPVLQSLLIADHVYRDASSGKFVVCGIFSQIYVRDIEVPTSEGKATISIPKQGMQMGSPFCYLSLINVKGAHVIALRYVHLGTEQVFFSMKLSIKSADPLTAFEASIPLPMLPNDVGVSALELLWYDEPLGSCRINVVQQPPKSTKHDET